MYADPLIFAHGVFEGRIIERIACTNKKEGEHN